MRIRLFVFVLLASCVLDRSAWAQGAGETVPGEDFRVEFAVARWRPSPDLTIQTGALARAGIDEFDFADEFGFREKFFSDFRIVLKPARKHRFRVGYVGMHYEESSALQHTINFGGRTFTGVAAADVRWSVWRFGYQWDVVARERGSVGVVGEVKYNRVRASVRSVGRGELAETDAAVPTLGASARAYVHRNVAIIGEFTAFKLSASDFDGTWFDLDISATASLSRSFGVQGGYRVLTPDYLAKNDRGDLKMKGPYFALVSRF